MTLTTRVIEPPRYQETPSSQLDSEPQEQLSYSGLMPNYQPVQGVDAPWLPLDSVEMDWVSCFYVGSTKGAILTRLSVTPRQHSTRQSETQTRSSPRWRTGCSKGRPTSTSLWHQTFGEARIVSFNTTLPIGKVGALTRNTMLVLSS